MDKFKIGYDEAEDFSVSVNDEDIKLLDKIAAKKLIKFIEERIKW